MRQLFSLGVITMLFFSACGGSAKPKDILDPTAMQAVMWDIAQADVFAADFIKKDTSKNDTLENLKLQQQIFLMHNTSREVYYKSFEYYKRKPDMMKALLDSITTMVNRKKRVFVPVDSAAHHTGDSIIRPDTAIMPINKRLDTLPGNIRRKRPAIDTSFKSKKNF